MEKDWVKIFGSDRAYEAEIVKGMLLDNGLNPVLMNQQSSPWAQALPGQAEIYVHVSEEAQAVTLIKDHNNLPTGDPNDAGNL
jgi:hypothetical protein